MTTRRALASFLLATFLGLPSLAAPAEGRKALLVANGAYTSFGKLANPAPEAMELKKALVGLGFSVTLLKDGDREAMLDAIDDFADEVRRSGGIAFFHYGGHGVQVEGKNYLLPVDADIPDERRVATRAVDLDHVLSSLSGAGAKASIIILDACRNNPLPATAGRSATRGLAILGSKPASSIVVYSAESGSVAQDGLFTPALCRALSVPGLDIGEVLMRTRREVYEKSGGAQVPGSYNQLLEAVYLSGKPAAAAAPTPGSPGSKPPAAPAKPVASKGFVRLPGGLAVIGSPEDEPGRRLWEDQRQVRLSPFSIAQYEVTYDEYDPFAAATDRREPQHFITYGGRGNYPVVDVSWYDAVAYCNWRSKREGLKPVYMIEGEKVAWDRKANGYRLPTEAEWEYACRAGTETATSFGDTIRPDQANYAETVHPKSGMKGGNFRMSEPVGSYPPNPWGLYDMHGNVSEWCWDWLAEDEFQDSIEDPSGPPEGRMKINRGGDLVVDASQLRSSERDYGSAGMTYIEVGFRLVKP